MKTSMASCAGILGLPHELLAEKNAASSPAPELFAEKNSISSAAPATEEFSLSNLIRMGCIGSGGTGIVYKVRHSDTQKEYALKVSHEFDGHTAAEADLLLRCAASDGIIRCHSVMLTYSGDVALLLDLMEAGSLHRILRPPRRRRRRRRFSEAALSEVAAQCLEGLAFLHSQGIVHLDIKPGNLLASANGDIKIGDLGFAQILGRDYAGQKAFVCGTTFYKSPERFEKDPYSEWFCDAFAADIWSFGVTLIELFSGRCPTRPVKELLCKKNTIEGIYYGPPPSLPKDEVSDELHGFLSACLQKDPEMRPTAQQLLQHPFISERDMEESRRALKKLISQSL